MYFIVFFKKKLEKGVESKYFLLDVLHCSVFFVVDKYMLQFVRHYVYPWIPNISAL
jgi:hypothetical protein